MNPNDPDSLPWNELRRRSTAPQVDVTQRVLNSIRELPAQRANLQRRAMAACAAVCAATAASIALLATTSVTDRVDAHNAAEMVIDVHEVDFRSLLP